jgi:hypothetical protein
LLDEVPVYNRAATVNSISRPPTPPTGAPTTLQFRVYIIPPKIIFLIFPHKRYLHHSQDPVQRKSKAIAEHSKYFSFQNRAVLNTLRAHLHLVIIVYFYYKITTTKSMQRARAQGNKISTKK